MKIPYVLCFTLLLNPIFECSGDSITDIVRSIMRSFVNGDRGNSQCSGDSITDIVRSIMRSFVNGDRGNSPQNIDDRIVRGEDAELGDIPYIVSVRQADRHVCGGSILGPRFILTAAHCVYDWYRRPEAFSIQYGVVETSEKGPNVLQIKTITMHEDYEDSKPFPNDIAVMETTEPIEFGPNVKAVELPIPSDDPERTARVVLAGWGKDKYTGDIQMHLKKVAIRKLKDEDCLKLNKKFDREIHICAGVRGGGKGQCSGDSGGPVTIDGKQLGIVSWSVKPCASKANPGIFARVSHYRDWIKNNTGV